MRVRYRLHQFFALLSAHRAAAALVDEAAGHLAPPLLALFRAMPPGEQRHAVEVCRRLEAMGYDDPDLLTAALLHDVGKGTLGWPSAVERAVVVIVEHFAPDLALRLAESDLPPLRAFRTRRDHPQWGAALVEQAGGSERSVALIRAHHDPRAAALDPLLAALRRADEAA